MDEKNNGLKKNKFEMRFNDPNNNPCLKEQEMSYECLDQNNYVKERCSIYFLNYNKCMEFWNKVRLDRKINRIYPELPVVVDREKIKTEYREK